MKAFLVKTFYSIAWAVARAYVDSDFFARVEKYVLRLVDEDLSGTEKFQTLKAWVKDEWVDVSTIFISVVTDAVLLKQRYG